MPLQFEGTVEQRLARLDQAGKRCDGNGRRCVHGAVEAYTLIPAKEWVPIPDAESINKQSCTRHRPQFINNPGFVVADTRKLPGRPPGAAHPYTRY